MELASRPSGSDAGRWQKNHHREMPPRAAAHYKIRLVEGRRPSDSFHTSPIDNFLLSRELTDLSLVLLMLWQGTIPMLHACKLRSPNKNPPIWNGSWPNSQKIKNGLSPCLGSSCSKIIRLWIMLYITCYLNLWIAVKSEKV